MDPLLAQTIPDINLDVPPPRDSNDVLESLQSMRPVRQEEFTFQPPPTAPQFPKPTISPTTPRPQMFSPPPTIPKPAPQPAKMSPEEEANLKAELLWKFKSLNRDRRYSPLEFDMSSPVWQIKAELSRIQREKELEDSLGTSRQGLLFCISALETISKRDTVKKFVDARLDGFSRKMAVDIDSHRYDDVLLRLQEKWGKKIKYGPEAQLLLMVCGSAFAFHLSNKLADAHIAKINAQPPPAPTQEEIPPSLVAPPNFEEVLKKMQEKKQQEEILQNTTKAVPSMRKRKHEDEEMTESVSEESESVSESSEGSEETSESSECDSSKSSKSSESSKSVSEKEVAPAVVAIPPVNPIRTRGRGRGRGMTRNLRPRHTEIDMTDVLSVPIVSFEPTIETNRITEIDDDSE